LENLYLDVSNCSSCIDISNHGGTINWIPWWNY
jgi:hypothetical protein